MTWGHNSAQDQTLFQEVQENNANSAQVENQKDLNKRDPATGRF